MYKKVRKAIFPVGGLGTRFLPATKSIPKEMLPVASKPIVQYAFEEALEAGIEQFIFITGRNKNAINNHFDYSYELQQHLSRKDKQKELSLTKDWLPDPGSIVFVRQQVPLGLGHAIACAKDIIADEPCAVILADELLKCPGGFLKKMVSFYNENGGNVVAVSRVEKKNTNKYGIVDPEYSNGKIKIKSMVEKPSPEEAPSDLSITGRYILQPGIFDALSKTGVGRGGEIQLTDAMQSMLSKEEFFAIPFEGDRFDCGSQVGFLEANLSYSLDNPEISKSLKEALKKYVVIA